MTVVKGSPLDRLSKMLGKAFASPVQREVEHQNKRRRIQYLKRKYSNRTEREDDGS